MLNDEHVEIIQKWIEEAMRSVREGTDVPKYTSLGIAAHCALELDSLLSRED